MHRESGLHDGWLDDEASSTDGVEARTAAGVCPQYPRTPAGFARPGAEKGRMK